jgi:hypothetical protein
MWPGPDDVIAHTCDTPSCVRNDEQGTYEIRGVLYPRWGHLVLTDKAGNTADAVAKARHAHGDRNGLHRRPERAARGEAVARAKLTTAQVREILQQGRAGETDSTLGTLYGVTRSAISSIRRRRTWRHVEAG